MALQSTLTLQGITLSSDVERRIHHQLEQLGRRLQHHPEPSATVVLKASLPQRQVRADLRLQLGPRGPHLISHQAAETPDRAVHLAIDDLKRQLERKLASQRGEPTYGVPSRRLPRTLRPNPLSAKEAGAEEGKRVRAGPTGG